MTDVMIDIESFGRVAGAPLVALAAQRFRVGGLNDPGGAVGEPFYRAITLRSNVDAGLTAIDAETLEWWLGQPDAARTALFVDAVPIGDAMVDFFEWLKDATFHGGGSLRLWANGQDYDLPILTAAYRATVGAPPWQYNAGRDLRTLRDVAARLGIEIEKPPPRIPHHAGCDVESQIAYAAALLRALGRLADTPRTAADGLIARLSVTANRVAQNGADAVSKEYLLGELTWTLRALESVRLVPTP